MPGEDCDSPLATGVLRDGRAGVDWPDLREVAPMLKRYLVDLTRRERTDLLSLLNKGIAPARTLSPARILLAADERKTDADTALSLHVHPATVKRTRRRFCRRPRRPRPAREATARRSGQGRSQAGGVPGGAGLQQCVLGPRALDHAAAGPPPGGAWGGKGHQRRDGAPRTQKTQRWKPNTCSRSLLVRGRSGTA